MSGFRELTYVHISGSEVYVDIQDDGTVTDLYTYSDDPIIEDVEEVKDIEWGRQERSSFLHAKDPQEAFRLMKDKGWITSDNEEIAE